MKPALSFLLLFIHFFSFSQTEEKRPSAYVGFSSQYGFLIAHRPSMVHLISDHVPSFELFIERTHSGQKEWEKDFNLPRTGLAFYAGNLANPDVIGYGVALFPYIDLHFLKKKSFEWNFRIGGGLGYISKPFERLENNKNNAIGSHFNGTISLKTEALWKLGSSGKHELGTGISFIHFSNGAFKMPNLGLNLPSLLITYRTGFRSMGYSEQTENSSTFAPSWSLYTMASGGLKEINPPGESKYFTGLINTYLLRKFSSKSAFNLGIDLIYASSLLRRIERDYQRASVTADGIQAGIMGGYEFCISDFHINIGFGGYLYTKYKEDGPFYHRLGARYYRGKWVYNIGLKTHFAKADFIEFGIGYKIL